MPDSISLAWSGWDIAGAISPVTSPSFIRSPKGYYQKGDITHIMYMSEDITERKQMEAVLRESEKRYKTLFEAESDTIFLVDEKTLQILDANRAAVEMYGYGYEELLRMRAPDLSAKPRDGDVNGRIRRKRTS